MRVLIACEESQEVCKAFRALGHEAYSCDIQEPSGGHPEWHIQGDALKILSPGWLPDLAHDDQRWGIEFCTMDKVYHIVEQWDLLVAHPPCTHLAVSGARWFVEGKSHDPCRMMPLHFLWHLFALTCRKSQSKTPYR